MRKIITLHVGEHYNFPAEQVACRLVEGVLDVYATTIDHAQRMFLAQRLAGEYAFSLCDEFGMVELYLMAKEETEVELYTEEDIQQELQGEGSMPLRQAMHAWFKALLALEWINYFAVRNDDYVGQWDQGSFLFTLSGAELWPTFVEHQNILSLLCNGQFNSLNKYFAERLIKRQENKLRIMGEAIEDLTGVHQQLGLSTVEGHSSRADLLQLIARALQYFKMEALELKAPAFAEEELDELSFVKFMLRKAGMRYRQVLLEPQWYVHDSGLLFVSYKDELALALPKSTESYTLVRQRGEALPLDAAVMEHIAANALQIYGGLPQRAMTSKDLYKYIYNQCWRLDFTNILLTSVILGVIPLLTPIITKTVFSDIVPVHDYQGLSTVTQVMLIAGFTTAIITMVRSIAVVRITGHIDMLVDAALWSRVLALPTEFFKRFSVGELVRRVMSLEQVKTIISGQFVSGIFNSVFSLWSLVLMCYYSIKLTAMCVAIWAIYLLIVWFVHRNLLTYQREKVKAENATSAKVVQIFNGLTKFRSRGGEEQAYLLWARCFSKEWDAILKLRWQNNYDTLVNTFLPFVFMFVIYYNVGNWMIAKDESAITATDYMAFNAAYTSFSAALIATIPLLVQYFQIPAQMENLQPILDAVPEAADDRMDASRLNGELELRNISFSYPNGPEIIHNLSLHINPGEKVAIVGPSGCGKSTLMRILLGFENATRGQVLYDGQDLQDLNLTSVRRQLGVVLQDGKLLSGSILDNIIGSNSLTIDDAWEAARKVALDKDIEEMPMGMHTMINEGSSNISGGQRQRILLARSIVNKPVLLLLDEATSALDNTTQDVVTKSLEKMHCTQIIVAHRLSTIRNADRIIVLNAGTIAEAGTFAELMALKGIFVQLAQRQLA